MIDGLWTNKAWAAVLAVSLLLIVDRPVWGHKISIYAWGEGDAVHGQAYFVGGGKVKNAKIEVFDPKGNPLGATMTDDRGEFVFRPNRPCDHRFRVASGDGHQAEHTVKADELPGAVADAHGNRLAAPGKPPAGESAADEPARSKPPKADAAPGKTENADLQELVERAVARQVGPLRQQIDQYRQSVRVHDVLGGIGYIAGLVGLILYLKGRSRRKS